MLLVPVVTVAVPSQVDDITDEEVMQSYEAPPMGFRAISRRLMVGKPWDLRLG